MDTLRLAVVPTPSESGGGFHVEVYVNDLERTGPAAGLGMDAYDLLIPVRRLEATSEARTVPIARCSCGVYGCAAADVRVQRVGEHVQWEWLGLGWRCAFDGEAYDREIARASTDLSWETPERTAGRRVLETVDRGRLASLDMRCSWVAVRWSDPTVFELCLVHADRHQIFVGVPWDESAPEVVAQAIVALLREAPASWRGEWHAIVPSAPAPSFAGDAWKRRARSK